MFLVNYSGNCAGEGQTRWLKPLSSKNFGVLVILNAAILGDDINVEPIPLVKHDPDQPEDPIPLLGVVFEPFREDNTSSETAPLFS
jgi:hypothetical protein